ncbi:MFS transporter [Nitratidesulfovibrio sp. 1201_IL3209]|uniref:MFS transporter n=1 Tax=Nitratidesulfovibrio sp. 1201_IL3209 TaxID=3084053 RepID=UPI002FD9AD2E
MSTETAITIPAAKWHQEVSPRQWRTVIAGGLGWALDSMDVMLYAMVIVHIMAELQLTTSQAGLLTTATLVASGIGGMLFGLIADKWGRKFSLTLSILTYSVFTAACGFSQTMTQLLVFRFILGLGMGGEWTAGAALVTETWPAKHRGKAMGLMQSCWALGYAAAALVTAIVLPHFGWRVVFFVGILPALFTLWVRRHVEEPAIWVEHKEKEKSAKKERNILANVAELFSAQNRKYTFLAFGLSLMHLFTYWGLFSWIPGYLSLPPEQGGAGLNIFKSATWVIVMQVGGWFGYVLFGFIADAIGRKKAFTIFFLVATILVPIYSMTRDPIALLCIGPFLVFFGAGFASGFGPLIAELFPTRMRATAQGIIYNSARAISAFAPFIIGSLAGVYGLGPAFLLIGACFLLGLVLVLLLPETTGRELE